MHGGAYGDDEGERYATGKGKKKRLSDVKGEEEEEALLGFVGGEETGLSGTRLSEVSYATPIIAMTGRAS